jgi:ERCC4-type nuclease
MTAKSTVICDDREKKPWRFPHDRYDVVHRRLATGDYTIRGLEKILCIERKASWEEIAMNVSSRKRRIAFNALLKRMQAFPIRFLVVCDDVSSMMWTKSYGPQNSVILASNTFVTITLEYGIPIISVGSGVFGKQLIVNLFDQILALRKEKRLFEFPTGGLHQWAKRLFPSPTSGRSL